MRRTLTTIGIFGTLMAGVYWLKDKVTFAPNIGSVDQQKHFIKGAKNEDRYRTRSAKVQRARTREDERASEQLDEIESLASIYQDQEVRSFEREQPSVSSPVSSNEEEIQSQAVPPINPIPGVKVSAWVSSQKNVVPRAVPDPTLGTGMRYFLNCMELKKKSLLPLSAKDCDALVADRRLKN